MNSSLFTHRSIRKYKPDPVPAGVLDSVLNAASRASTTGNMQVYSMVVTSEAQIREQLWDVHFKQNMVLQAPVIITFCADFNRFNKWCELRKAEPGFDNFLSFFTAAIDALLASQNAAIEAENQGLGICYLGTTTYNAPEISEILKLPSGVVPVTTLVLGYPDENPPLTDRLPMEAVVHREIYNDFTADSISQIYFSRENSEFSKELLRINEKETLAQIYTDKRYTKKDNEFFSTKYLEFIKKQGFKF
jgi:FMN reductase (NADPH)